MSVSLQRRAAFLDEMGLGPVWTMRNGTAAATTAATTTATTAPLPPSDMLGVMPVGKAIAPSDNVPAPIAKPVKVVESAWSSDPLPMPAPITPSPITPSPITTAPSITPPEPAKVKAAHATTGPSEEEIAAMDMAQLKAAVARCTKCGLCKSRTKTVFGVGDEKAKWLFIGEGPGRNEDLQGEPFVGPAGKLLDNMLVAMDLKRGANAYIANIVKCRPTGPDGRDRPPTPEEAAACLPYLQRQIALIQPAILVALGKSAAVALLKADPTVAVSSLRGKLHRYAGLPLVVTYHPAYLLRTPVDKRKTWADLSLAMQTYAGAAE